MQSTKRDATASAELHAELRAELYTECRTELLSGSPHDIARAASLLAAGESVAFPTETVYGLGAEVFNEHAVQKVFWAKGRPQDNPLIVHCVSLGDVERLAEHVPERFYRLYERFAPGPLTMLLPRSPAVPASVSAGLETVAVRFPAHPVAQELLRVARVPLVAPSANRSGCPSPTTAQHVMDDLAGRIAAVVDGGICSVGIESTVVDIVSPIPLVLRPGTITQAMLEQALGEPVETVLFSSERTMSLEGRQSTNEHASAPRAPGMKYRHYAPKARVVLVGSFEEVWQIIEQIGEQAGGRTGQKSTQYSAAPFRILAADNEGILQRVKTDKAANSVVKEFICTNKPVARLSAQTLYAVLREADADNVRTIIVICDEAIQHDAGLMNRLLKAAE